MSPDIKRKCYPKRQFKDRIAALMALAAQKTTRNPRGYDKGRAYRCPYCGRWHLGR